jgi:ABC-type multidrug transport system ATPase subunit
VERATSSSEPALRARGVSKRYRSGFWLRSHAALAGVDLEVAPGSFLGLIGPNGSGKSTFLRLAAGVESPSGGALSVFGSAPDGARARQATGYVSEGSPFPPELPARAVLRAIAGLRGFARREARTRAESELERFGLRELGQRPLGKLSTGQQRRFALAQAFLHGPELLLLDEPSAGLDAEGHAVLAERLGEARESGTTAILASHQGQDAFGSCEEVCVLIGGKLVLREFSNALAARADSIEIEFAGKADPRAVLGALAQLGVEARGLRPAPSAVQALYRELAREHA